MSSANRPKVAFIGTGGTISSLGIHPLAVLIVTIAGGCLFGMIGLVLAAPLTSAIVHISHELARAQVVREAAEEEEVVHEPA